MTIEVKITGGSVLNVLAQMKQFIDGAEVAQGVHVQPEPQPYVEVKSPEVAPEDTVPVEKIKEIIEETQEQTEVQKLVEDAEKEAEKTPEEEKRKKPLPKYPGGKQIKYADQMIRENKINEHYQRLGPKQQKRVDKALAESAQLPELDPNDRIALKDYMTKLGEDPVTGERDQKRLFAVRNVIASFMPDLPSDQVAYSRVEDDELPELRKKLEELEVELNGAA